MLLRLLSIEESLECLDLLKSGNIYTETLSKREILVDYWAFINVKLLNALNPNYPQLEGFESPIEKNKFEVLINKTWKDKGLIGNAFVIPGTNLYRYHLDHLYRQSLSFKNYITIAAEKDPKLIQYYQELSLQNFIPVQGEAIENLLSSPHKFTIIDLDLMSRMTRELFNQLIQIVNTKTTKEFFFRFTVSNRYFNKEERKVGNELIQEIVKYLHSNFSLNGLHLYNKRFKSCPMTYFWAIAKHK